MTVSMAMQHVNQNEQNWIITGVLVDAVMNRR